MDVIPLRQQLKAGGTGLCSLPNTSKLIRRTLHSTAAHTMLSFCGSFNDAVGIEDNIALINNVTEEWSIGKEMKHCACGSIETISHNFPGLTEGNCVILLHEYKLYFLLEIQITWDDKLFSRTVFMPNSLHRAYSCEKNAGQLICCLFDVAVGESEYVTSTKQTTDGQHVEESCRGQL